MSQSWVLPRAVRRLAAIVAGAVTLLLVLLALMLVLWLRSERASTWAAHRILSRVQVYPGARLDIENLSIDADGWVDVRRAALSAADTLQVASVGRVRLHVDWAALWKRSVVVDSLRVDSPQLELGPLLRGLASRPAGKPHAPASATGNWQLSIGRGHVDAGQLGIALGSSAPAGRLFFRDVSLRFSDVTLGPGIDLQLDSLGATASCSGLPHPAVLTACGGMHGGVARLDSLRLETTASRLVVRGEAPVLAGAESLLANLRLEFSANPLAGLDLHPLLGAVPEASALRAAAEVRLAGERLASVDGSARVLAHDLRWGRTTVSRTAFDARFAAGQAEFDLQALVDDRELSLAGTLRPFDSTVPCDLHVDARAGSLALRGEFVPSQGPRWRIHDARVSHLDLAELPVGGPPSDFNGSLQGSGRGFTTDSLFVDLQVALAASSIASVSIDSLHAQATLQEGVATLALHGRAHGTAAQLEAQARPFASEPALDSATLRFQHFDLARWFTSGAPASDLTGTLALAARGLGPRSRRAEARLVLASGIVGQQELGGGELEAVLVEERVTASARLRFDNGGVAFEGAARPFGSLPSYTIEQCAFTNLDLGALLAKPALASSFSGHLSLTGQGASLEAQDAQASLFLSPSTVFGLRIDGAQADATYDSGAVELVGELQVPGGGGRLDASGVLHDSTATYRAQGRLRSNDLGRLLRQPIEDAGLDVEFTASGEGLEPDALRVEARLAGQAQVGEARIDTLAASASLAGKILRLESLAMGGNVLQARAAGVLQLPQLLPPAGEELHFEADLTALGPLGKALGVEPLDLSQGHLRATVHGNEVGAAARVSADARQLTVGSARASRLQAEFAGSLDAGRRPVAARGLASIDSARVAGLLLRQTRVDVDGNADTVQVAGQTAIDDSTTLRVVGRSSLHRAGAAALDSLQLRLGPDRWALRHPVQVEYGRRLQVDDFQLQSGVQRLAIDGTLDQDGEQRLAASVDSLQLRPLGALLGWPRLAGLLDGEVAVTGPAAAPRTAGLVDLQLQNAGQPVVAVTSRFVHERGQIDLTARVTNPAQDSLTVTARVPLAIPGAPSAAPARGDSTLAPIDVRARADDFDLASLAVFLPPQTVRALGGKLWVDARARGDRRALDLEGSLRVAQGAIDLPALGTPYTDIALVASLAGDRVSIENLRAAAGRGTLQAQGGFRLSSPGELDLDVRLSRFRAASTSLARVEASGDLRIDSTLAAPVVTGKLTLSDTDFDLSGKAGGSAIDVELTPDDLRMLEENFGYRPRAVQDASPSVFAATTFGLVVEAGNDTWVRRRANPRLALEIGGSVEVRKGPHQPLQVFGKLEGLPQRSYAEQLGRRFDLETGSVVLNGDPQQALIDFAAKWEVPSAGESEAPEATIRLQAKGTIDKLDLSFSSDPAMDETQIVSYITTGRPPQGISSQSHSQAGASDPAKAIAIGQASAIVEDLGTSLGLDVLQVRDDGVRGVTMMAGNYMNPKTYVGIRQSATFQTQQNSATSTGASTEIEVEYELLQWLLVNCQGGVGDLRVMFRSRFPY